MSWENELREKITFVSPLGNVFFALWKNNDRSFEKKLGMFDSPKIPGTIVQDLDVKSTLYPLTVFFDGMSHNKDADDFFIALKKEIGQWEVTHPVRGPLALQLMSCTESMNPIDHGNYTQFNTEWIEPANVTILLSTENSLFDILSNALNFADDCITQLAQLRTDLYSAVQSAINTMNKVAGFMDKTIKELTATNALIQESYNSARVSFNSAIASFGIDNPDTAPAGRALINMATSPVEISSDFSQRFSAYNSMSNEISTLSPDTTTIDDYNSVIAQEFGLALSLIAIAQIVASSEFSTRVDVISAIENVTDILNNSISIMENAQDNFSGLDIDRQYYSQSQNYTILINLYAQLVQFLLGQFYGLSAEMRYTLKKSMSPLDITVTEYGELGDEDYYYDLFLKSNNLSGKEIMSLPAGKEVVIYAG